MLQITQARHSGEGRNFKFDFLKKVFVEPLQKGAPPLMLPVFLGLLTGGVLFLTTPIQDESTNHCHDQAVWAEWGRDAAKQSRDLDFQTLHALWMGLCTKLVRGQITEDEADSIFEQARNLLIQQRREDPTEKAPLL